MTLSVEFDNTLQQQARYAYAESCTENGPRDARTSGSLANLMRGRLVKSSNMRNRHSQGETEFVECLHMECLRTAHPDGPVPLCGKHIGEIYQYATDLIALSGVTDAVNEAREVDADLLMKHGLPILGNTFQDRANQSAMQIGFSIAGMRMAQIAEWGLDLTPEDRRAIDARAAEDFEKRDVEVREIVAVDEPVVGEVVYYMRFGDRVKIGYSSNLARRLTAIPNDELLATEPGTRAVEAARHRQFRELRLTGEWFDHVEPLVGHIEGLRRAVA